MKIDKFHYNDLPHTHPYGHLHDTTDNHPYYLPNAEANQANSYTQETAHHVKSPPPSTSLKPTYSKPYSKDLASTTIPITSVRMGLEKGPQNPHQTSTKPRKYSIKP